MKPVELAAADLAVYAHKCFDEAGYQALEDAEKREIAAAFAAAKGYVGAYTGLDLSRTEFEDVAIAILTVGAEMLDNRQLTAQYTGQNPMVMQILDLHSANLLPEMKGVV